MIFSFLIITARPIGVQSTISAKAKEDTLICNIPPEKKGKGVTDGLKALEKLLDCISYYRTTCRAAVDARK